MFIEYALQVRFTLLHADERMLERFKMSDGSVRFDTEEEERPVFYYSKPLNYLKRRDRSELIEALLQIRMMQKKFEQWSPFLCHKMHSQDIMCCPYLPFHHRLLFEPLVSFWCKTVVWYTCIIERYRSSLRLASIK